MLIVAAPEKVGFGRPEGSSQTDERQDCHDDNDQTDEVNNGVHFQMPC
jgi:hypothetical protein